MSPIRTRRQARRENDPPNLSSQHDPTGTAPPLRATIPKNVRRRTTIFRIEQSGKQREILTDKTSRTNAMRLAKKRRTTSFHCEVLLLLERGSSGNERHTDSSNKDNIKGILKRSTPAKPHVHWEEGLHDKEDNSGGRSRSPWVSKEPKIHSAILALNSHALVVHRDPPDPQSSAERTHDSRLGANREERVVTPQPSLPAGITLRTRERSRSRSRLCIADLERDGHGPFTDHDILPVDVDSHSVLSGSRDAIQSSGAVWNSTAGTRDCNTSTTAAPLGNPRGSVNYARITVSGTPPGHSNITSLCASSLHQPAQKIPRRTPGLVANGLHYALPRKDPPTPKAGWLPGNTIDRYIILFSMIYFPIVLPMLARIFGFL